MRCAPMHTPTHEGDNEQLICRWTVFFHVEVSISKGHRDIAGGRCLSLPVCDAPYAAHNGERQKDAICDAPLPASQQAAV